MKLRATLSAINVKTGGLVRADEDLEAATEWASREHHSDFLSSPACCRFSNLLTQALIFNGALTCFRGRRPPFKKTHPSSDEMGPPTEAIAGRYNGPSEVVLYLSDSEDGVQRECGGALEDLHLQRFIITSDALKLVDLRAHNRPAGFLSAVMWIAELAGSNEHPSYPSKRFSQAIANLVSKRFDGMVVPGVRGEGGATYSNIVIFRASAWQDWLDESAPRKLTL